ncbi:MAG TPA: pentapeptide repeat-containing protein [Ktedonobacteraceae bacterium]|nr:pentapeptide repeat-containing protein [Ktedonobacteraceae bacterium]
MSDQDGTQSPQAQVLNGREAWKTYWEARGQPWRTEAEIDAERQHYLAQCRAITPDPRQGAYPFKDIALSRADVEWLLATHENGRGPVDWSDESQRERAGLDLRGADLRRVDLQNLPLAYTIGDVTWMEWRDLTLGQRTMAALLLEHADLKGAHLEHARLSYAHMERADLREAHLEGANLAGADLEGAYLRRTHLEGANLFNAHLDESILWEAHLEGAALSGTHLEGALLSDIILSNEKRVGPRLADVRWGDVNLAVVRWSQVKMLGEEEQARQKKQDDKVKDAATRLNEYETAVRANRQLATALSAQGLNEDAAHFAYHAQKLQRVVLRRRNKIGQYLFSGFLYVLAGYGYRPGRSLIAYLLVIGLFATTYALLGQSVHPSFSPLAALVFSITSFHGRGFFPGGIPLDNPITVLAALEAIMGLIIEISFIATFTQRYFAK